ncbi:SET and MYND domain-containing protein 4-like [Neocloeon triangulifer]|uniref:SET and MYND domain-containing protein 4-like n=1 Tax=Neocloeon triangulifer TaxID=2078957 RepID=UPI00286EF11A|nr:SET and MYND domain-containing protein 4-like [Neocloeon triangulifer]
MNAFSKCIQDYNSDSVRQRLDRRHASLDHCHQFVSDRTKIFAESGCYAKCASALPRLTLGPSDEAPRLSSAVRIHFTQQLGRHLIAKRDIQPGEVLICEEPFAAVLAPECRQTHCSLCMKRPATLIPCNYCSLAYFCDENCRSNAWKKFHENECRITTKFLTVTTNEDNGEEILLAIRLICTVGLEEIKRFLETFPSQDQILGFTDGKYFPNFNAVFHLVTNLEQVPKDYLNTGCRIALHLIRCFNVPDSFAAIFLRIILGLDSNTHSMREMIRDETVGLKFNVIGCAIYPSAALCNHSCDPNLFRATHGNYTVHRARRLIRSGEILTECYKSLFIHSPTKERRSYCKMFYYFECGCEACVKDWPLLEDLPENPVFGKGETQKWTEYKQMLKTISASGSNSDLLLKQDVEAHIELLNFLVSNDKRLCRLSFELEKKIQNYFCSFGNCYFRRN